MSDLICGSGLKPKFNYSNCDTFWPLFVTLLLYVTYCLYFLQVWIRSEYTSTQIQWSVKLVAKVINKIIQSMFLNFFWRKLETLCSEAPGKAAWCPPIFQHCQEICNTLWTLVVIQRGLKADNDVCVLWRLIQIHCLLHIFLVVLCACSCLATVTVQSRVYVYECVYV